MRREDTPGPAPPVERQSAFQGSAFQGSAFQGSAFEGRVLFKAVLFEAVLFEAVLFEPERTPRLSPCGPSPTCAAALCISRAHLLLKGAQPEVITAM